MKKNIINIGIPCALVLALFNCGEKETQQKAPPIMPYPVVEVAKQNITTYENFPASIEGEVNSEVRPKISGYIKEVLVTEGQAVKQGQLLFKLETQSLSQDAQAAKANVNAAQVEVNKLKPLVEKNIISSVQLETANAKLLQAQSAYNSIGANINYANVKSPVNGVVGSINFRKGALVSAQDPMPLTNVSAIDDVYAYFSMNEKAFISFFSEAKGETSKDKLELFPEVKLLLANGELYDKTGKIETITGDINAQTGSITFRAKFDNKAGILRNGSSGTVLIPKIYTDVMVIPSESTFERQGKSFVYKVINDSLVDKPVTVLKSTGRIYLIEDGLEVGETILAKGLNKVSSGSKIKPIKKPLDSIINSFETVFK
ncbi:MAG: efflux transporter periplasmic adaptor subunit [Flavobacteriaceae bacterium]|uniref:efflux RND transporter periplasmic adaptor subunit n=1 Tax=Bizionia echini TaxID=649333 RepID=UPI000C8BD844|nr:efflux transporter periplasmic adaptor subunit [Flavobacteriaceae bacterium]